LPGGSGAGANAGEPSSSQPPIKSLSFSEMMWTFAIKEHRDLDPVFHSFYVNNKVPYRRYFRPPLWRSEQQQLQGKDEEVVLDVVHIVDRQAGKMLNLNRKKKEFVLGDAPVGPVAGMYDPEKYLGLAALRTAIRESGKPLGAKKINGREAVGYRIDDEKPEWQRHREGEQMIDTSEVWLDAKSQRPLFYERIVAYVGPQRLVHVSIVTRKDFVYDEKLDDALFSMKPPEGYKEGEIPRSMNVPAKQSGD
jgi:hypothetical protein